jgi:hypothetical protein
MYERSFSAGGGFLRLAWSAFRKRGLLEKSGRPLVWLRSCRSVISCHDFGSFGRRSPIVSFRASLPLLTSESATAPLNALAVLAMRMRLLTPMGRPFSKSATPAVCIF